ncbi:MAG: glycosyltransferase [Candidatus Pacearchaeota archaeon]
MGNLKVLQISTPFLPVSPNLRYGGTERVVYLLEKELSLMGISAGVVAPENSSPYGRLYGTLPKDIGIDDILDRSSKHNFSGIYGRLAHIAHSINYANNLECDIVHLHDDNFLPFFNLIEKPALLTLHSDIDGFWNNNYTPFLNQVNYTLVAISQSQKKIYENKGFKVSHVVYNGIDENKFEIKDKKENFLLSLGSIQPVKGQSTSIQIAKKSGLDLLIAGNIGDKNYFLQEISPHVTHDLSMEEDKIGAYQRLSNEKRHKIVYLGPVNDRQKVPLYSNAKVFLMPIEWDEPFGLVMIEAMMSGTPVIAFNRGSVPEIVKEGTGMIVPAGNLEEMLKAISEIEKIDSQECRNIAVSNFGKGKMVENYVQVYNSLVNK